ncbi:MAG: 5'/3'-nucleotidase SurE [Planctomycetota bacterium]
MRILLTNDDGIYAPGLRALRLELQKIGTVEVVAPATEQSATGHSVTLNNPIVVQEIYDEKMARIGWAVEGRPADCVKLALRELLGYRPDLIVSGLNAGSNAGINVLYSGTVAAAIEGAFFGITSIACSLEYTKPRPLDFNTGAGLARQIVEQIINKKPAPGALFNVNIPSLENGPVLGVRVAPQNTSTYEECFDKRTDPRGRTYFWLGADFTCPNPTPETDTAALRDRFITVTPLQFNLTEHTQLEEMYSWNWTL